MDAYTAFAAVYDRFMADIPYDQWYEYLKSLLDEYEVPAGSLVLELGCGTGAVTGRLAAAGYDMIGVDNSMEMLEQAKEKALEQGLDILYLQQDMQEFELYGTVAAVVSLCDSMNYLTEPEELTAVCRLVNNYLDPGGIFIFDLKTVSYYMEMGDSVMKEEDGDTVLIWENTYYEEERINEYALTLFLPEPEKPVRYRKETETHYQRAYTVEEVTQAVAESGMELLHIYRAFTREAGTDASERLYVIAREKPAGNKVYRTQNAE